MLARWEFATGQTEFCVEYLDAAGENVGDDAHFDSEQQAEHHAASEFGLAGTDWHDGHPTATTA